MRERKLIHVMSRRGAVSYRSVSGMAPTERGHLPVLPEDDADAVCDNPRCMGNYDFDDIARFAKQRFVDGVQTIALLEGASSTREREEIALVSMLDVHDDVIRDLRLDCRHAGECKTTDCRARLKTMIEEQLAK